MDWVMLAFCLVLAVVIEWLRREIGRRRDE